MGKVIGIDLGTTNSCVAVIDGTKARILENSEGDRTTPSIVGLTDGERLVGGPARSQAIVNPETTLYAIKRLIGRRFDDPETQKMKDSVPFNIVEGDNGDAWVEVEGTKYAPAQISAMVLQKMKETAEEFLGEEVTEAVITVPAYFNDAQRQATKDAGKIAGLEVKRIINEPTAAALAYGLDKKQDTKVAVYDLGGGTFDVSILEIATLDDDDKQIEVLSTNGDTFLGGEDFDNRIIDYLADEFKKKEGIDLKKDKMALQRLKDEAEKAKIALSNKSTTKINLPYIAADEKGAKHLDIELKRATLEKLVADLIERTKQPMEDALKDAKLSIKDIDEVILVGGMTRMPKVAEAVEQFFGKKPMKGVNPDEVVADGAAIQAGVLTGEVDDVLLLDVTPLTLGLETKGGVFHRLIERGTTIPTSASDTFSTAVNNQPAVSVRVFQGERDLTEGNMFLGQVDLTDIPPAPAGIPKIKVEFNINSDGIVEVTAKDLGTNKEIKAEIEPDGGLSDSDVERMLKEAQAHAEDDKKRKEAVETANFAEALVAQTKDALDKYGDQLPDDAKQMFEAAVKELNEALENEDEEKIKELTEGLTEALPGIGEIIYGNTEQGEDNDAADANTTDTADSSNDNEEPSSDADSTDKPQAQNNKKKPGGPQPG